jgi:hypothetical protein
MLKKNCALASEIKNNYYIERMQTGPQLFTQQIAVSWPIRLFNNVAHKSLMAYFICYRKSAMLWVFAVKAYSSEQRRNQYVAHIGVRSPNSSDFPLFSMASKIFPNEATEADMIRSGLCLLLNDNNIRQICGAEAHFLLFARLDLKKT